MMYEILITSVFIVLPVDEKLISMKGLFIALTRYKKLPIKNNFANKDLFICFFCITN